MNPKENKTRVLRLLKKIHREGMSDMIDFLVESDYFTAPASSRAGRHSCFRGGLCHHSMCVARVLVEETKVCEGNVESAVVVGLLHDLGKVNFYEEISNPPSEKMAEYLKGIAAPKGIEVTDPMVSDYNNCKSMIDWIKAGMRGDMPELVEISYRINDQAPLGHGEKALFYAAQKLTLTMEEATAIRWHMGPWDAANVASRSFYEAHDNYLLPNLLMVADYKATMYEGWSITPPGWDVPFDEILNYV